MKSPLSFGETEQPDIGGPGTADGLAAAGPVVALPRTVIRGESKWVIEDADSGERVLVVPVDRQGHVSFVPLPELGAGRFAAFSDWLNCTFPIPESERRCSGMLEVLLPFLGSKFAPAIEDGYGFRGWTHCFELGRSGARLAYGGQNNTAFLSLSGEACSLVNDWPGFAAVVGRQLRGRITRWDGAVDDYVGDHSVDVAIEMYRGAKFGAGGRPPAMKQFGNWDSPDGSGRTLQVGNRAHGKMLRIYEKGMELGAAFHPWVRWEVELHNKDRVIPWAVLSEPGRYVVGAYPKALAWVQRDACRIETIRLSEQLSYERGIKWLRRQCGKWIDHVVEVEGSPERAIARLRVKGIPRGLQHPLIDKPSEWIE